MLEDTLVCCNYARGHRGPVSTGSGERENQFGHPVPLSHVLVWLDQLITNPSLVWLIGSSPSISVSPVSTTKEAAATTAAGGRGVGGQLRAGAALAGGRRRQERASRGRCKMAISSGASSSTGSRGVREAQPLCPFCRTTTVVERTSRAQNNLDKQFYTCRNRDWVSYFSFHFFVVHFGLLKS